MPTLQSRCFPSVSVCRNLKPNSQIKLSRSTGFRSKLFSPDFRLTLVLAILLKPPTQPQLPPISFPHKGAPNDPLASPSRSSNGAMGAAPSRSSSTSTSRPRPPAASRRPASSASWCADSVYSRSCKPSPQLMTLRRFRTGHGPSPPKHKVYV